MIQILSIEWLKIRKYSTFWILAGLFMTMLLLWNWSISSGTIKLGSSDINILSSNYSFPEVWGNVGYWTKFFAGLIAIIIIILTTNEFQFRTDRQNVIDGLSRTNFFHAKWILVLLLSLAVTLFTFSLGIFFGIAHGSSLSNAGGNIIKIFHVFILTLNYFGFALTLSLLLRRSGMSIIIFLLYCYMIEVMLQQFLNWKIGSHPGNYLPMQCSAELFYFPLPNNMGKVLHRDTSGETSFMIASGLWLAAYYCIGRIRMLKSDW